MKKNEIKEIAKKLRCFCESFLSDKIVEIDLGEFKEYADQLEELGKQLDEQKEINKQPANRCIDPKEGRQTEWISVEDALPEDLGYYLVTVLDFDNYKYSTSIAKWRGRMFAAEDPDLGKNICVIAWLPKSANPAPFVPTFRDIFLKRFPKTETIDGRPALCLHTIFPYVEMCDFAPQIELKCKECWSQPYFEEEGEADA